MPTASAMSGDGGDVKLKKEIGVVQGASIILGVIIGSGVFVSPVGVLKFSQSTGLSFVMWIVAGLFSTFGAIVYAELGVTIPESGGEYAYVLKEFGPVLAFLCLWITFIIIGAVSCAANALIFAEYLVRPFFDESPVPDKLLYIIAALGLSFIFYQDLLSLIELAGFAFVMVSFLAVLSLIHHRYKHPKFNAGFKLPLFFPVAFLVIDVILGVMTVIQQPMESFYSILMFLAGIVFFLLWTNRPAAVERYHIKFTRTMQKLFLTVPQDREDDSNNANVLPMKSEDSSLVQEWEASITPEHSDTKKRIKI